MMLCYGTYKKKRILFVALGTSKGKIIALKVQEPPSSCVLSDGSISKLRSSAEKLLKLGLSERLAEIKHLVPEWPQVYRTYNPMYLHISEKHQISSS
jgi:hypothetical protein